MALAQTLSGKMTAVAGFSALVISLVAIDERVREQFVMMIGGQGPSTQVKTAGAQIQGLVAVIIQAIRDQSMEHAPLVIFAVAALVLVLLLLRTDTCR